MRKANLYLNILKEMQCLIQFQPNWDVEKTLPKIYAKANLIKTIQTYQYGHRELAL